MMKILILGHTGMLGHMVNKFLLDKGFDIITNQFRWSSEEFKKQIKEFDGDYIINCIGAIHQRTKNFEVNWELPIYLDFYSKCKIIHPGTDCEMDSDDYGISKKIARDFIVESGRRTKSIKTSILGPELNTKASLMEWVLSQENNSTIKGFSEFYWNGNTTLTWAKICLNLINNWEDFDKETIISSECISKYQILKYISEIFDRKLNIIEADEPKINKCLQGQIITPNLKEQLIELKKFMEL